MEYVSSLSAIPQYTKLLFDNHRKNVLYHGLVKIADSIKGDICISELLSELQKVMVVQEQFDKIQDNKTDMAFIDTVIEYINHLYAKESNSYYTGLHTLDYILKGFRSGEVTALSGRSGMGKSDFALFLALKLACKGVKVLYLTMEMSRIQIMNRVASRATKMNSSKLLEPSKMTEAEKQLIIKALDSMSKISIVFDEQQNLNVYDIQLKINKHKPQVVFIDHIGLMAQDKYKKQWENMFDTSKALKQLAMSENVALIELVQQNSEVEKRKEKQGKLSDLKGSDGIGNDCDNVMFVLAEKSETVLTGDMWYDTQIQIVKNRNGPTGTINFHWFPQYHDYKVVCER